ncbi:MAG: alpha/beta fold hydrolase, partial [Acidimicrobiia bacterium]|nr:alpha/beta fold hydrolase [Acidimicrobiia bacterium]
AVLTNPGGPGGSGLEFIANGGSSLVNELGLSDFDLVGFDPRGVDRSGGLDCVDDKWLDEHTNPDYTPDDRREQQLLDEARAGVYAACKAEYGESLVHYSTANTARDMDAIREALGDEQVSYLGISYGTYLGAVYATLFPDRVRAMVLDSSYEPVDDTVEQQYTTQLVGFEGAFDNWAQWCADDADRCLFSVDDADAVEARWDDLSDALDRAPLTAEDGREVNQATLLNATIGAMYSDASWPDLGASLQQAEGGDPAGLLRMSDRFASRNADGTYSTINESGPVIRCASGIVQETPDDPEVIFDELREVAPRFSRDIRAEDLRNGCDQLLDEPAEVVVPDYDGEAPILVTGGLNDPATPLRWAEELDERMGGSSVFVQFNGEGHGQVLSSDCITEMEGAVLADLELPDEGAECEPDPEVEKPEWWDGIDTPEGISDVEVLPALLSALGLSPATGYGEVRLTELSVAEVQDGYGGDTLGEDFVKVAETEILTDVYATYFTAPDDLIFLVLVMPPAAFETKELESARGIVPEGQTAVVLAAISA